MDYNEYKKEQDSKEFAAIVIAASVIIPTLILIVSAIH